MSETRARYFAPTYFSPFYFTPLVAPGEDGAGTAVTPYRDMDAYGSILSALRQTGAFAEITFGVTPDRRPSGADRTPAAVVTPDVWSETDDTDPVVVVRRVSYALTLIVRDDDPVARYDLLDRLSCVAQNAVDGTDLGGGCLAALTRTRRGRFDTASTNPEQGVVLLGEFTYLITTLNGHGTTRSSGY